MKKKLLIAAIAIVAFLSILLAGYFSLPFFLKSQYFLHLVENKTHIRINKIYGYKISQNLTSIKIHISALSISSNRFNADAKDIKYKLNLSELISKKPSFGSLNLQNLNIYVHPPQKKVPKIQTIIKPLPISIDIAHLNVLYNNYNTTGRLNLLLSSNKKNNTFSFKGLINKNPIALNGNINPENLNINLNIKKFSSKDLPSYLEPIENSSLTLSLKLKNNLEPQSGQLELSEINYKGFLLKKPIVNLKQNELYLNIPIITYKNNEIVCKNSTLKLNTTNFDGTADFGEINVANLKITNPKINFKYNKNSQNYTVKASGGGFLINANGKLDTRDFQNTSVNGFLQTPYINYVAVKPLLNKHIQEYIISGKLKANKVTFNGLIKDKENIIKTGNLIAQDAKFIVEKDTYPLDVTQANIDITPKDIIIEGVGFSDKVNLENSKLIIARKKGYPASMHLVLSGEFTKNTEDFLHIALLNPSDLKYIDYATDIRGRLNCIVDIKNYYWRSLPYFDFNVNIDANLSLIDKKISTTPINLIGKFDIQRKNQAIKISANNLTAKNDGSFINISGYIEHLNDISYNAVFSGKLEPNDIKNISYLKMVNKKYLPTTSVTIKPSSIWGTSKQINFNSNIEGKKLFKESGFGVDNISAKGYYKNGLISFNPIKLDGALQISGLYNIKAKAFNGNIAFKDFLVSRIKNLLNLPINEATLNGNVKLGLENKKIQYIYSNNLAVNNLIYDNDLIVKSVRIQFDKNYAKLTDGYALVLDNPVNFSGSVNIEPLIINLDASSTKFIVKKTSSKIKSYIGDLKFKIPNASIFAHAHIDELVIEDSRPFLFNNVNAQLELAKKHILIVQAPKTTINISMDKNTININAKDSYIFSHYIQSKTKKPTITTLNATLQSPSENNIDIKHLTGSIKFVSENGNIKDFPDIYKILSLADILGLITGQINLKEGFYFDKMVGVFKLENGVLTTVKPLTVKGTSNNLFINGNVNLTNYHTNALFMITTFTFINRLISYIPIIGHILGGKEKSFTGLSFRVDGYLDGKLNIYPVPFESLSKGLLDIIKRTITLPAYLLDLNGDKHKGANKWKF